MQQCQEEYALEIRDEALIKDCDYEGSDSDGDIIPREEPEDPDAPQYTCGQCEAHSTHSILEMYHHKQECDQCLFCVHCGSNLSIQPVTDKLVETVEELIELHKAEGVIPIKSIREPKESKDWFKRLMDKFLTYSDREATIECVELLHKLRQFDTFHRITATMIKNYLMNERNDVKHIKAKYNRSSYYKGVGIRQIGFTPKNK
jgi:hypothetical protein